MKSHFFARTVIIAVSLIAFGLIIFMMVYLGKEKQLTGGGVTLTHRIDTDDWEMQDHFITLKVEAGAASAVKQVLLHYFSRGERHSLPMSRIDQSDHYAGFIPGDEKGVRNYYYFEVLKESGDPIVFPAKAKPDFQSEYHYFKIRNEGRVTRGLLWAHILLMTVAIFLFIHALYYAIDYLKTGEDYAKIWHTTFWGTLAFFISGFPIGWVIEKQVLGNYWEGIPFGWDITDSKTLFIFLYWLIIILLHRFGRLRERGFARAVIFGALFAIVMFMLPHSL
jgi:hypothetical protein